MTMWKPGMLAVCVDASPRTEWIEYYGRADYCPLTEGKIYRVFSVEEPEPGETEYGLTVGLEARHDIDFFDVAEDALDCQDSWGAYRFRPLVTDEDDAELIARIKSCKPQKLPIPSYSGMGRADAHTVGADSSVPVGPSHATSGKDGCANPTCAPVNQLTGAVGEPGHDFSNNNSNVRGATASHGEGV